MRRNNLGYLSTLLLTAQSVALGMIAYPVQGTHVVPRLAATAHTTLAKSSKAIKIPLLESSSSGSKPNADNTLRNVFSKPAAVVAQATSLDWPTISLTKRVSGLSQPVHITHAEDGSGRLFVVEQSGRIRIIKNGVLLSQPFLNITSRVSFSGERGLLSVAFPLNYADKKYFYVYYTNVSGNIVVARYRLTTNPDVANSSNQEVILTINHQQFPNHNGGQLAFGPDGYLYIGTGDGGGAGDPLNNGQNRGSLLGKMLRIDVESRVAPYAIPASNPFRQTPGYRPEIWALGLRNPFRFSFDRQQGDLYIGDVGQNTYEEINFEASSNNGGKNYGWRIMEGANCFNATTCDRRGLTLPIAEYNHSQGSSITGGVIYRGQNYLEMYGVYFYADFINGKIWGLKRNGNVWQNQLLHDTGHGISSFGEDQVGNLYLADYFTGDIYLITSRRACTITGSPGNNTLRGTNGNDVICGLGGNDTISGGGGSDLIYGDAGNDLINGGAGNDVIQGSGGIDAIAGEDGNDTIYGSNGSDRISGGNGNDFLGGGEDNDTFNGGSGIDTCLQSTGTGSKTSCEK